MNRITPIAAHLLLLALRLPAHAEAAWSQDFEASKKQAASSHQDLLLDFTGSDWCGPCIALHKTIFSTEAFEAGVKGKFELVKLDYPRAEDKLPAAVLAQNKRLQSAYGVSGFPTVLLCDAEGLPYAATVGFSKSEPDAYVAHLNELRGKREARDKAFAAARAASGTEKARLLAEALTALDLEENLLYLSYAEVVKEIGEADPADSQGLVSKAASKSALARFQSGLSQFLEAPGIHTSRMIGDLPGALTFTNEVIASGQLQPSDLAGVVCFRANMILARTDIDAALKSLDEIKDTHFDEAGKAQIQQTRGFLEKRKATASAPKTSHTSPGSATNATPATSSGSATNATPATSSGSATNATPATSSGSATNSSPATSSGSATNASPATSSGSATNATPPTSSGSATNTSPAPNLRPAVK